MAVNLGSLGEAFVDIRANLATLDRDLKRVSGVISRSGTKLRQTGSTISTFITLPILGLGGAAIKTASDVQEMRNLFKVTFEDSADEVEAWANATAKSVNRSRFDLMRTASDFAAFLKPLGVADKEIAPMSKALTQLTTDISSFRNMTEEDVFTRLFSGLAGETEAVRRLGVDIGQAAIEQELLRLGINKTQAEATQAEKVMARYNLIMRQTVDAQGDAARTAGSFENRFRGLMGTVKEIAVVVGQRFLPLATRMLQKLRELGEGFLGLSNEVQSGIIAIVAFTAVIGPALIAIGLLVRGIGFALGGLAFIPKVLRGVFVAVKVTLIGIQVAVVGFLGFFSTIPGLIILILATIVGGFFIFKDTIIGFFKGLVIAIKNEFVAGFNNLVVRPFQRNLNAFILSLRTSFGLQFDLIGVNDIIENDFTDEFAQVMSEAKANGARELAEFKDLASGAIDAVKGKFGELKDAIGAFIPDIELADITLENMGGNLNELLNQFKVATDGMSELGDAAAQAGKAGAEAFDEFGTTIKTSVEQNLTDALTQVRSFGDAARAILGAVIESFIRLKIVNPIVAALPIPGLAMGGRLEAGQAAIVGERGRELFVPSVSGQVIPNHRIRVGEDDGAGIGGISQTFHFPLAFPPQLEAFIINVATPAGREAALRVMQSQRGRI